MRILAMYLAGGAAIMVLAAGVFVGLPFVIQTREDYGSAWGVAALIVVFLVCIAAGWLAFRLADLFTRHLGPLGRATAPEQLYCQRCGQPTPLQAQFCPACGHTHLGLRRPATASS